MMKSLSAGLLLFAMTAGACATDGTNDSELGEVQSEVATPVPWKADFNQLPGWLPWPKRICEALNGAHWTVGENCVVTLSNCTYNTSTKECSCSETRSGTGC